MKVKDLIDKGIDDFELELIETEIIEGERFPKIQRYKLEIGDIGYSSKIILLDKLEK